MTFKWSAKIYQNQDFQPRSLCSFSDGGEDGSSSGGGGGGDTSGTDTSGFFSGDQGGDFFGGGGGGFLGTNDAGGFVNAGPDVSGGPTVSGPTVSGDTFGGQTFADNSLTGGGQTFGGDPFSGGVNFAPDGGGGGGMNFGTDFGAFPGAMAPTAGVDFTGGGQGFGINGPAGPGYFNASNTGMNNAVGPPGWATSDYGAYSIGGPTGTGFGPGAGPSVGGPSTYGSVTANAGVQGFPGDFGAPPGGGTFGMPGGGQAGPQAGPGMPGGPSNVGNAEPGFMPPAPEAPTTVTPTDQRGENFFGPQSLSSSQTASNSVFGPNAAQAADRGTDTQAIMAQSDPFAQVAMMANQVAQTNPDLAQALMGIAANQNTQTNMVGPMMTGFEGPSPGAQQGFTGMSPAQQAASGPFTGQPSLSGVPGFQNANAPEGKSDLAGGQAYQMSNADIVGGVNAAQNAQQQAAMSQAAPFDAQALGEQGRGPGLTGQQNLADAFAQLEAAQQQQSMQQAVPFDAQALGEQGRAGQPQQADTFDSRFGDPSQFAPTPDQPQEAQVPPDVLETIARSGPELTTGLIGPQTQGVGREGAPLGLLSMMSRSGGEAAPFGGAGRSGAFGPTSGGGRTSADSRPGGQLSITVSPSQFAGRSGSTSQGGRSSPGYYMTGGAGIAPGAKGAEYGGIYGPGVATGRPGTNTFGIDSRSGAQGFYDARTGMYYR